MCISVVGLCVLSGRIFDIVFLFFVASYFFYFIFFFFFSSRRRHTRCLSDWSSDVCSSDLFRNNAKSPSSSPLPRTRRILSSPPKNLRTSTLPSCTRKASLFASSPSLNIISPALKVRLETSPLGRLMLPPPGVE